MDFNQVINRDGTEAEKYTLRKALFGTDDVLPMWVADMDLPTPDFIREALKQRLDHPILGYTGTPDSAFQAIIDWQAQHDYAVHAKHIVMTHNVANGFFMAVQAFCEEGDSVIVQTPVYPPFLTSPGLNNRQVVKAPLVLENGRYEIDFEGFESAVIEHQVKLFLFCNPQNPSGRVWSREEQERLGQICLRHGVTIISDEIHSDLVFSGRKHVPMASISKELAQITVTLSSPGKTFNLGGLQIGYAIIANPTLRQAYLRITKANSIHDLNVFGMLALQAAYSEQGKQHRDAVMAHFQGNIEYLCDFLSEHLPDIVPMQPEASFLVWLDFSKRFDDQAELKQWLIEKAKLGLNDGLTFGAPQGFMRINIAVPRPILEQAMQQLKQA